MTYRIQITRTARKDLLSLDDPTYQRTAKVIELLQENPRPDGARKLRSQEHAWRIRVGDYRILYEINDSSKVVDIYRIKHRREAYR